MTDVMQYSLECTEDLPRSQDRPAFLVWNMQKLASKSPAAYQERPLLAESSRS